MFEEHFFMFLYNITGGFFLNMDYLLLFCYLLSKVSVADWSMYLFAGKGKE